MTFAALAVRNYGEGKICIHTDKIGAIQTGHRDNPKIFWRKIFEWATGKKSNETIKVGLVINSKVQSADRIHSLKPINVQKINLSDIAIIDITKFDCLYFVGLPVLVDAIISFKIEKFVREGGGLILESPDRGGENINILADIEDVYCYSSEKPIDTYAYWTNEGMFHYVFYGAVSVSFMTTLREEDFSTSWSILMSDVENTVTTTTSAVGQSFDFGAKSTFEFAVGFISSMQKGIVVLETGEESSSSHSSLSSSSSSYSSSSYSSSSSSSSSSMGYTGTSSSSSSKTSMSSYIKWWSTSSSSSSSP